MVNRPSTPEIITVNSEDLQTQIRDLLPSQNGFGSELQASNVITPIIDLTSTAEGSGLPSYLQTAIAFGSQTAFNVTNTTTDIITGTGFYRVIGTFTKRGDNTTANSRGYIQMTDGLSTKVVYGGETGNSANNSDTVSTFDLVFFHPAGITTQILCGSVARAVGSVRQIATGDGTLIEPSGYPL